MRMNLCGLVNKQSLSRTLQDLSLCTVSYDRDFAYATAHYITRRFKLATTTIEYIPTRYRVTSESD